MTNSGWYREEVTLFDKTWSLSLENRGSDGFDCGLDRRSWPGGDEEEEEEEEEEEDKDKDTSSLFSSSNPSLSALLRLSD